MSEFEAPNSPVLRRARLLFSWAAVLTIGFAAGYVTHPRRAILCAGDFADDRRPPHVASTSVNLAQIRARLGRELAHLWTRERLLETNVRAAEVSRGLLRGRGYGLDSRAYQQNEERRSQAAVELEDVRLEITQVRLLDERIESLLHNTEPEMAGADSAVIQEALRIVVKLEAQRGQRRDNVPLMTVPVPRADAVAWHEGDPVGAAGPERRP